MRKERKDEHIEQVLRTEPYGGTLLDQVVLEPVSFPELALSEIDTSVTFFGRTIPAPLMINAMTGGTDMTKGINRDLAQIAKDFGLPMQVGSQVIALEDSAAVDSFHIVRETLGQDGLIIGNVSASVSVEQVKRAMEMIDAQGIGVHINPSQEMAQEEGDRDFRGLYDNLRRIAEAFPEKVIVKEVGFGMSCQDGRLLRDIPVEYIDVSGSGGTNFMEVEDQRSMRRDLTEFYSWGIPTAKAIWNVRKECPNTKRIASGGIKTATDVLHAHALGADMSAISGELLRYLMHGSLEYAEEYLQGVLDNIAMGLLLLGCRTMADLHHIPYLMVGRLKELVDAEERTEGRKGRS